MTTKKTIGEKFTNLIGHAGVNIPEEGIEEIRQYATKSMVHLSTIAGQPGYELALEAERDIIAIKIGMRILNDANDADKRFLGLIEGALRMASLVIGG